MNARIDTVVSETDKDNAPNLVKRISEVTTQRSKNRRSIFLDGEFAFGVAEETYVKFALVVGRTFSDEELEGIKEWDEFFNARQSGYGYAVRRRRSRHQIVDRLRRTGYSEAAIEDALRYLKEYGLLDDAEYVRCWVHERLLKKEVGRFKLTGELRAKGVAPLLIDEVLNELLTDEEEIRMALNVAAKKYATMKKKDPYTDRRNLSTFLNGRGFGRNAVAIAMESIFKPDR